MQLFGKKKSEISPATAPDRPRASIRLEQGDTQGIEKLLQPEQHAGEVPLAESQTRATTPTPTPTQDTSSPSPLGHPKSPLMQEVETILSEGLEEFYQQMSPEDQNNFRILGEKTAGIIVTLLEQARATSARILQLLRKWLAIIPHVNRFFLEQESKLKTDHIMALQRRKIPPR